MISTMNTRTGNAQSRDAIELEEDAMLTAIGQSSLDEMADKYADRWEDFVAAMSRWRSIHELLRLGQLNKTLQRLSTKQSVLKEQQKTQDRLIKQCQILSNRCADIMTALEEYEAIPRTYKLGKSGRKPYDTKTAVAVADQEIIAVAKARVNGKVVSWFTKPVSEWKEDLEWSEDNLELANIKKRKGQKELDKTRVELQKTQDQYDITKPYAMGLLVADIFYTLASAIQGEIYL